VIPSIISQCFSGEDELHLGNLTPTRDFTFVKDVCSAFLEIYRLPNFLGEVCNIGTRTEVSINDLAQTIMKLMHVGLETIEDNRRARPEKSEVERLVCDSTKLTVHSGWRPAYDLDQGLEETIRWFKDNPQASKGGEYLV
jgi:dTDP-glucose 4,6-dehydratase